jgi:hypothetical protein
VTLLVPVLFIVSSLLITDFGKTPKGNALLSKIFPKENLQVDNVSVTGLALFENWDESIEHTPVPRSEWRSQIKWGGNSFPNSQLIQAGWNILVKKGKYSLETR